jgi:hypothetical protein
MVSLYRGWIVRPDQRQRGRDVTAVNTSADTNQVRTRVSELSSRLKRKRKVLMSLTVSSGASRGSRAIALCARLAFAVGMIVSRPAAVAQPVSGTAAGTITDTAGAPVAGAKVVALNFNTGIVKRVVTDDRGNYTIDGLQPGAHKIRISAPSYVSVIIGRVLIEVNSTRRADAKMRTLQPGQDGDTMLGERTHPHQELKNVPHSTIIQSVSLAAGPMKPFESNGDLWFTTWADDDNLYGTWGDGRGATAEFSNPLRTDCGVLKYSGSPPNLTAKVLLRDAPTETNPPADNKPSSVLFFGKRLYGAFHTPLGDARLGYLAYSDDYGAHWKREGFYFPDEAKPENASPWTRDQNSPFRCMLMINMGKAYGLNKDGFVYVLAIGTETNWKGDVYLARVKKQDILKYAAWQYFTGTTNGQPHWSQTQKDAVPVPNLFATDQGSAIYHPGVKRYLFLTLSHLFEAPTPWGPWTLAGDFPYDKPEWQRGYQPGIIPKGLGANSFWFTISSQNRPPYITYSLTMGQMVMHLGSGKTAE